MQTQGQRLETCWPHTVCWGVSGQVTAYLNMSQHVFVAGMPLCIRGVCWPLGTSGPMGHVGAGQSVSLMGGMSEPSMLECVEEHVPWRAWQGLLGRSPGQGSGGMAMSTASRSNRSHPPSPATHSESPQPFRPWWVRRVELPLLLCCSLLCPL